MKIIFLDIDGVLNSMTFYRMEGYNGEPLDPAALARLQDLQSRSGAEIILTSSWRGGWNKNKKKNMDEGRILDAAFAEFGMHITDKTGIHPGDLCDTRPLEIKDWLRKCHKPVENYVILDDADYNWKEHGLTEHLVQTDYVYGGLTTELEEEALRILNERDDMSETGVSYMKAEPGFLHHLFENFIGKYRGC